MSSFDVLTDRWPVVVFNLRGEVTVEMVDQLAASFRASCERQQRFVHIFDLTAVTGVSARTRRQLVADAHAHEGLATSYMVAIICIVPSRIIRSELLTLQWAFAYPHPLEAVADMESALVLAEKYLRGADVDASAPRDPWRVA